jgi:hypothetical protein
VGFIRKERPISLGEDIDFLFLFINAKMLDTYAVTVSLLGSVPQPVKATRTVS